MRFKLERVWFSVARLRWQIVARVVASSRRCLRASSSFRFANSARERGLRAFVAAFFVATKFRAATARFGLLVRLFVCLRVDLWALLSLPLRCLQQSRERRLQWRRAVETEPPKSQSCEPRAKCAMLVCRSELANAPANAPANKASRVRNKSAPKTLERMKRASANRRASNLCFPANNNWRNIEAICALQFASRTLQRKRERKRICECKVEFNLRLLSTLFRMQFEHASNTITSQAANSAP